MNHRHFSLIAVAAAILCSCSNEPALEPAQGSGQAVNFTIGTVMSRTITNDDNTTEFVAGDRIGIFGEKGAVGSNASFFVGSDGSLQAEAGNGIFYNAAGGATADFYAYYPFVEGQSGQSVNFTVGADQSSAELFNASDFMTASTLGVTTGSETPVSLIFKHRLAVVQLEIQSLQTTPVQAATLCNVLGTAQWNRNSDEIIAAGETMKVEMWQRHAEAATFCATVPAQTIAEGTRLFSLNFGEESYAFTTSSAISLSEGVIKKFRISVGEAGQIVVLSPDLVATPWNEDSEIVEGSGELVGPEALMPLQDFSDFAPVLISKNKEEITTPGWYLYHLYDNDILEICSDGNRDKVMHIKRVIQEGKSGLEWHNGAYYFAAANPEKRIYTLTFTARSSFSENMKGNQLRIGAYMKDAEGKDHFVALKKGDVEVATIYYQVPSEEYATYTLEFDMSKVSTVHNGNPQQDWLTPDAEMLKLVTLYISSNANGIDFWIDDISWK